MDATRQGAVTGTRAVSLRVNGVPTTVEVEPFTTLLELLHDRLGLTGVKYGCGNAECGACAVHVDGRVVCSCVTLALQADGRDVTTIEGLGAGGALHPVQEEFVRQGAFQCGFCVPGMVMSAAALLAQNADPTEADVRRWLAGNICRCGGYNQYFHAVVTAARRQRHG